MDELEDFVKQHVEMRAIMDTHMNASSKLLHQKTQKLLSELIELKKRNDNKKMEFLESSMSSCTLQEESKENMNPARRSVEEKSSLKEMLALWKREGKTCYMPHPIIKDKLIPVDVRILRRIESVVPLSPKERRIVVREEVSEKRRDQKLNLANLHRGLTLNEDQGSSNESSLFDLKCLDEALP